MVNAIVCPHCGKTLEITEALKHQIESEIVAKEEEKFKIELEKTRRDLSVKIKKELEEKSFMDMEDMRRQLEEKNEKVKKLQEFELRLREENRKLEEKKKEIEIEAARTLASERKKLEETISLQLTEQHRLKEKEKDKVIDDLKKALDDAQRKASQGSQQLQGEVKELDLESTLQSSFPHDAIEPVGKGVRGADVRQIVKSPRGTACGVILWESKRTKAWSDDWTVKLKDDLRAEKANIPVVITQTLPREAASGIGLKDGVWVCADSFLIPLATLLRQKLLEVAYQKAVSAHKGEKADFLYEYVTGHEFRQQVEAIVEVYQEMQLQIVRERAAFEKSWKAREAQTQRLLSATANVYGSMQGLVGSSLPQVKGLDLLEEPEEPKEQRLPLE